MPFWPTDMTLYEQKAACRADCAAKRLAIPDKEKNAADAAMCRHIASHPAFLRADLILTFFAVRGEPDLSALLPLAAARGIPVAFPRCVGKELFFHTVDGLNELTPDRFDIPAPAPYAPPAQITERTLCLLPGLAATKKGERLGYGGGFYDRFLVPFRGITLFPIYERLVLDALPTEATDRLADHIITEKGELTHHG